MSELTSGFIMDYVDELGKMVAKLISKDYTVAMIKCQELLDKALEQRSDYEDYLDEEALAYDNMKLQELGLPF